MSGGSHDYICYKIENELVGCMKDTRKILRAAVYDTRTIPSEAEIEHLAKADLVEKI